MFTLHALAVMLGGGLDQGLELMVKELGVIRLAVPDSAGQVDRFKAWLVDRTNGQWTEAALEQVAVQFVGLFTGTGWGPPNAGGIAGQM